MPDSELSGLDDRIGELFCCGWSGATAAESRVVSSHARALIEQLRVGGIILMGRNLGAPEDVARLTSELQSVEAKPLWIGVDQEGGAVARFTLTGITFPGNMALGAARNAGLAERAARAIGEQLRAMGVNMNFAPVLDVNNNPRNPIIGTRSFGEDPALVAELGVAAARGFLAGGVVPVGKHFPGHGDTDADSHLALPVQPAPRERLEAVELAPFSAALRAGYLPKGEVMPAVMTTHILFPALDPELPATLSRRILTGLLRDEWGYKGVVITDCMEMQGIADHWGPEEAAVLALEAGADLLLVCHTWEIQQRMVVAVREAVRSGRLSEARIDASVERLLALKREHRLLERLAADPSAAAETVGAPRYREIEREVARAALTVVNDHGLLPLPPRAEVSVSGPSGAVEMLAALLDRRGVRVVQVSPGAPEPLVRIECPRAGESEDGSSTIVAALREPYLLEHHRGAGCRIACYSDRPCALDALADLLVGRVGAKGRLPVTLE